MAQAEAELKRLLGEFNARHRADLSMVLTRTGISIAHEGPRDFNAEAFASLAVTLMNAAEVLYLGLGRTPPNRILLESDAGTLVASELGTKAMFVALGRREDILRGVEDLAMGIRAVMSEKRSSS